MKTTLGRWLRSVAVASPYPSGLLAAATLVATFGVQAAPRGTDVVSVSAVNYSGRELNGVLFIDPRNKGKVAGGPPLLPYGGSGEMCCYELPHTWKPGLQVKIRFDWWEGDVPRNFHFLTVELPPYPTDEPGTLWALFYEDGTTEVFASAIDPGHPKWPGKVKHWPVPSREYRLKLWQMEYHRIASLETYYKQMIAGLSDSQLRESWDFSSKYEKAELRGFKGPDDPAFTEHLKSQGEQELAVMYERLRRLEEIKP